MVHRLGVVVLALVSWLADAGADPKETGSVPEHHAPPSPLDGPRLIDAVNIDAWTNCVGPWSDGLATWSRSPLLIWSDRGRSLAPRSDVKSKVTPAAPKRHAPRN